MSPYDLTYFKVNFPSPFVAYVEINGTTRMNTFVKIMWLELRKIFDQLSYDPDVRSIILSGAGDRAFTAGLDVNEASSGGILDQSGGMDPGRRANEIRRVVIEIQDCITSIERCEKRFAIDVACCCDIRLCSSDVQMSVKEVDIGLAADLGTLNRLPKIVRNFGWVKEVCLTARTFGSNEALREGFVNKVMETKADALTEGLKLAKLLASKSPVAVIGTKELLNYSRDHTIQNSEYSGKAI
ncbi:MAG: hypothetical protein Q9187_000551 [Circinaria calcarea]